MISAAATLYAILALFAAAFQFALAAGAPWGHLTLGGRHPGALPLSVRAGTLVQSALFLGMAAVIAGKAGLIAWQPQGWSVWVTVLITGFSALGNLVTPSQPERRLWAPVTVAMLAAALFVAFAA